MLWKTGIMLLAYMMIHGCINAEENLLNVMSFNLRHGLAKDGDNSWPHRRNLLVEAIKHCNPDVLGTQECRDMQAAYLEANLPDYRWIGIGRDPGGAGEMTAVFYKKNILLPMASGHFWLSETPEVPSSKSWDTSLTRMCTWVRFQHIPSGRFFFYMNTHFDHVGEQARIHSAELLVKQALVMAGGLPVLITGDFNAEGETSRPWAVFHEEGFQDAWLTAPERKGPKTTCCGFNAPDPNSTARIDWILSKGGLTAQRVETVVFTKKGRYPSDHFPVVAVFSLL
ncbi:MAG TPA: endonuclease/exonuclease/phosphatase family protein [Candidatus Hydrogenedentes bacterium]|nr:endonuclease/exonuclease/phosphatase family protein [Candidatus Hydrogenedentota bacterium]